MGNPNWTKRVDNLAWPFPLMMTTKTTVKAISWEFDVSEEVIGPKAGSVGGQGEELHHHLSLLPVKRHQLIFSVLMATGSAQCAVWSVCFLSNQTS